MAGDRSTGLLDEREASTFDIQVAVDATLRWLPKPVADVLRAHGRAIGVFLLLLVIFIISLAATYPSSSSSDDDDTESYTDNSAEINGLVMVELEAGSFTMGSDVLVDSTPAHTVSLTSFKISDSEVTNAMFVGYLNVGLSQGMIVSQTVEIDGVSYDAAVGAGAPIEGEILILLSGYVDDANQCHVSYNGTHFNVDDAAYENWPVTFVQWYGAHGFSAHYGCDLPTEAEWEYAARGGDEDAEYATATGLIAPELANYNFTDSSGAPVDVRSFGANDYGLYDMSGNAAEWVSDFYSVTFYDDSEDATDPVNEDGDREIDPSVVRGGSFATTLDPLQIVYREYQNSTTGWFSNGFRVVARPE